MVRQKEIPGAVSEVSQNYLGQYQPIHVNESDALDFQLWRRLQYSIHVMPMNASSLHWLHVPPSYWAAPVLTDG